MIKKQELISQRVTKLGRSMSTINRDMTTETLRTVTSMRPCDKRDLDALVKLHDDIWEALPDKTWLRRNNRETLQHALVNGISIGVFSLGEMVAIGMLIEPDPPETDLRQNLKVHKVDKAINLKLILVHEDFRGRGFQRSIIKMLESLAVERGYTHFLTSVSPDNTFSWSNMLAVGFEFDHQENLYGGLVENIYVKTLRGGDDKR